jgi:hypothetical protein
MAYLGKNSAHLIDVNNAIFNGTVDATGASVVSLPSNTDIGSVDDTEISYLNGVTSAIQTQLNGKENVDADILRADTTDNLTVGYTVTSYSAGTKSSGTYTPDPALGNIQHATNNGAHTLAPPTATCTMVVEYYNDASAGTITTSGFTKVGGDAFTTTSTHKFMCFISKTNGYSYLNVVALQ